VTETARIPLALFQHVFYVHGVSFGVCLAGLLM